MFSLDLRLIDEQSTMGLGGYDPARVLEYYYRDNPSRYGLVKFQEQDGSFLNVDSSESVRDTAQIEAMIEWTDVASEYYWSTYIE